MSRTSSRAWFLVGLLAIGLAFANVSHAGSFCSPCPSSQPAPSSSSSSSSSCAPPSCFNLGFGWLLGLLLGGFG